MPGRAESERGLSKLPRVEYFEHDADYGIVGRGLTIEAAFEAAAEATFGLMAEGNRVRPLESVTIIFTETDEELALVEWLNELLAAARIHGLAFGSFTLARSDGSWVGTARGEPWTTSLERGTEVKGATLTMLSVTRGDAGWEARCVVDV